MNLIRILHKVYANKSHYDGMQWNEYFNIRPCVKLTMQNAERYLVRKLHAF